MTGEVIKSFLVGLGFDVDDASLSKFNKSIQSATLRVTALYGAIQVAGAGILAGISDISDGFEKMGYEYRIIAPAINKALFLRRELLKAYDSAGVSIVKVIQNSVKLNISLAKTKFAFKAIYDSVGSRFFTLLTKESDAFREKLYKNMPQIQNVLERLIKFVFKAIEATTEIGTRLWSILVRVYDFFAKLDEKTEGWSTIILAVVAAWKLLNLEFLASPLGILFAVGAALLALYDDYETFKEGGNSLFDWTYAIPVIEQIKKVLESLTQTLNQLFQVLFAIGDAFIHLISGDFEGFWFRVKLAAESFWNVLKGIGESISNLIGISKPLGDWAIKLFGGTPVNPVANIQAATSASSKNPIGATTQNNQTNQHVNQQTNINVIGSADAGSVGKTVASEQTRVNFDMIRNLKGSTR